MSNLATGIGVGLVISSSSNNKERKMLCKSIENDFESIKTPTIEQKKVYSDCIDLLYNNDLSGESIFWIKAVIIFIILCMVFGGLYHNYGRFLGVIWGFIIGVLGSMAFFTFYLALDFLINA